MARKSPITQMRWPDSDAPPLSAADLLRVCLQGYTRLLDWLEMAQKQSRTEAYLAAQITYDTLERARDIATLVYIETPSIENRERLIEAQNGLREARRKLFDSLAGQLQEDDTEAIP